MQCRRSIAMAVALMVSAFGTIAMAHCQIPCGIYDDSARFDEMAEHIATVEKSMKQIVELSKEKTPDYNQLVRWVRNKDEHADTFSTIVTYYFMAQRVIPVEDREAPEYEKYDREITMLHQMVYYAMKTKQTTDLKYVEKLRYLLKKFKKSYSGEESKRAEEVEQDSAPAHAH